MARFSGIYGLAGQLGGANDSFKYASVQTKHVRSHTLKKSGVLYDHHIIISQATA